MNIALPATGISGRYRMVVSRDAEMNDITHDTGEFDNLITNAGMNRWGEASSNNSTNIGQFSAICGRFTVGVGASEPKFTDTALGNAIAVASIDSQQERISSGYDRGYSEIVVRHQFAPGEATGNLSEIGIVPTGAGMPLFSRALIVDVIGNPTTITVLPEDFLTCYYTLRVMIPQSDAVFNIGVDLGGTIVPTVVTARPIGTEISALLNGWGIKSAMTSIYANLQFYNTALVDPRSPVALPSPQADLTISGFSVQPYVTNSFQKFVTRENGLNEHNGENLRLAVLGALMGTWQIEFDPPLQKDNTQTMTLTFGYSWARA